MFTLSFLRVISPKTGGRGTETTQAAQTQSRRAGAPSPWRRRSWQHRAWSVGGSAFRAQGLAPGEAQRLGPDLAWTWGGPGPSAGTERSGHVWMGGGSVCPPPRRGLVWDRRAERGRRGSVSGAGTSLKGAFFAPRQSLPPTRAYWGPERPV